MATPPPVPEKTTCAVVGGGPAGMMLGLLLARAGVDVTVLEKHPDFLRDFRGDTVHASTLRLLDELGLGEQFARIPQRRFDMVRMQPQGADRHDGPRPIGAKYREIALVPQWDFLELLATAAAAEPGFRLLRNAEVTGVVRGGGGRRDRVLGIDYRDESGDARQLRAALTVACDGRSSTIRSALGLIPRTFGVGIDVWWFRLPRRANDPELPSHVSRGGQGCVAVDRGDYYQIGYTITKGSDVQMRTRGIEALREAVASLLPPLADRVDALHSMDDVKLLDVQINRLNRWYVDGLLLIGDAAHAMSPAGGVGVNLAIADAVAAARLLAGPLRDGVVLPRHLARVQARRWIPTVTVQLMQRGMHAGMEAAARREAPRTASLARRLVRPAGRRLTGYLVAWGPLSEHAPKVARR